MKQSLKISLLMFVCAVLFVLLIVIVVSPNRRAAYVRNLQRQRDVAFIGKIVTEYQKTEHRLPEGIEGASKPVCRQLDPETCGGAFRMPTSTVMRFATSTDWLGDPKLSSSLNTGYFIATSSTIPSGFMIWAPQAELGVQVVYPK